MLVNHVPNYRIAKSIFGIGRFEIVHGSTLNGNTPAHHSQECFRIGHDVQYVAAADKVAYDTGLLFSVEILNKSDAVAGEILPWVRNKTRIEADSLIVTQAT